MSRFFSKHRVFITAILLFSIVTSAFASDWNVGYYIDEFDDPTGEYFIYYLTTGYYSNESTTRSPCEVRVIADVYNIAFANTISFRFDIHEDSFSTPVRTFNDDSVARYAFKDDAGNVTRIWNYDYGWDYIEPEDSTTLYSIISGSSVTKVSLSIENTRYSFEISNDGFAEAVSGFTTDKSHVPEWTISSFKGIRNLDYVTATYYTEDTTNDKLVVLEMQGYPDLEGDEPLLMLMSFAHDDKSGFYYNEHAQYSSVTITNPTEERSITYTLEEGSTGFSQYEIASPEFDIEVLKETVAGGETITFNMIGTEDKFDCVFTVDGAELLKYLTYPY